MQPLAVLVLFACATLTGGAALVIADIAGEEGSTPHWRVAFALMAATIALATYAGWVLAEWTAPAATVAGVA